MRTNGKAGGARGGRRRAEKVAIYDIGEDEAGMRLDRWLRRRFPDLPQSHLMKIVRKGEVRVSRQAAPTSRPGSNPGRRCACRR